MAKKWPSKDPDERLDYSIDWAGTEADPGRLYGSADTIVASEWVVPDGLTEDLVDPPSFTDTTTTIWLTDGVLGTKYQVENRITTAEGRIMDQSVYLTIKTK